MTIVDRETVAPRRDIISGTAKNITRSAMDGIENKVVTGLPNLPEDNGNAAVPAVGDRVARRSNIPNRSRGLGGGA